VILCVSNEQMVSFGIIDTSDVGIKFKTWESKAADDKVLPSEHFKAIH
jgi:hypothetical protein